MKLDPDIVAFFSDQTRLERIDQLHALLFDCLSETEKSLRVNVEKAIKELADHHSRHWKWRRGRVESGEQIGLTPSNENAPWPADLWVHFGWNAKESVLSSEWIGIYTQHQDVSLRQQLTEATKHIFENPVLDKSDDWYPIFEYVPDWPGIRSTTQLEKDHKIAGLVRVLRDGGQGGQQLVVGIRTKLAKLLDQLDQLAEELRQTTKA